MLNAWLFSVHAPSPFPPAGAAAAQPAKEPVRRFCEGLLPLKAEIQSNPEQPEPPRKAAAHATPQRMEGVRWKAHVGFPPAALRARVDDPSTRESGPPAPKEYSIEEQTYKTDKSQFVEQTKADFLPLRRAQLYAPFRCIAFVGPHKQTSIRNFELFCQGCFHVFPNWIIGWPNAWLTNPTDGPASSVWRRTFSL